MKTYQVTLPDEIAAFLDRVLAEKKWGSVDHLFAYALLDKLEKAYWPVSKSEPRLHFL